MQSNVTAIKVHMDSLVSTEVSFPEMLENTWKLDTLCEWVENSDGNLGSK